MYGGLSGLGTEQLRPLEQASDWRESAKRFIRMLDLESLLRSNKYIPDGSLKDLVEEEIKYRLLRGISGY